MLNLPLDHRTRQCDGWTRRDFMRVGSVGLGGLSLAHLLRARAAAGTGSSIFRNKSVVFLYLSGGPSHIETFDPQMDAPPGIRSITGDVETSVPGIRFGGTFERLAEHADKMALVHSFQHSVGGHVQAHSHILSGGIDPTGQTEQGFSLGAAFARLRGTNHPDNGLPTYALITEDEIDNQYRNERGRIQRASWPGSLGVGYAPYEHTIGWREQPADAKKKRGSNPQAENMTLNLSRESLESRLALRKSIDRLNRQIDASGTMEAVDKFSTQAVDLLLGGAAEAFDIGQEDPKTIARYDTSHIQIGHKVFRPSTLGKQFLLARRLIEAGCGFITLHCAGWDMHHDGNNPGMVKGMDMLGRSLDIALSAFLGDLEERGMLDDVLFVLTGDFGRTPKINSRGGRDHWPRLSTLAFAGGGLHTGQIIGQSTRGAYEPATEPLGPSHLLATVMHTLFNVAEVRLQSAVPRDIAQPLETAVPVPGVM